MRNIFYRISSAMARFMYGRNGADQLGSAMLAQEQHITSSVLDAEGKGPGNQS